MKHRIKNSLATVQALASQTLRTVSPEEMEAFIARLHAIATPTT
jgi:two-component sensor histidine kinase